MKNSSYLFLVSLPLFTLWFCTASPARKEKQDADAGASGSVKTGYRKVAVLELFTSQGCSSCPPADRLMGKYAPKENVIVLSYHVDYWDRLGWKDPFSSKAFTQRQYNYAAVIKSDVYTPQLVINGQSEMIGSNESKISAGIKKALGQESIAEVSIKELQPQNGRVSINFMVSGYPENSVLNIALIQDTATTEIRAGENGGITLPNYNVVRNFEVIDKVNVGDNAAAITIPADLDPKNCSLVVFLQEKGTNKILAADQAAL